MKVAKSKVWENAKSELVVDGDDSATVLVARAGENVADSQLEKYKNADKFFSDAVFDGDGKQVIKSPKTDDDGPKPKNREDSMPHRKSR